MKRFYIKIISFPFFEASYDFGVKLLLLFSLPFFMESCESFVEVDPPQSELTGEVVFEDSATAEAALANIYGKLRQEVLLTGNQVGISYSMGLYADELDLFRVNDGNNPFRNNTLISTDNQVASFWSDTYNLIFETNAIIEGVANSTGLSIEDSNQITGEALFLRACLHFYLVNLFGDIPYITTSDFRINTEVSRITEEEVYTFIVSDLEEAKSLLLEEYVTGERVRANKSVASALLARVFLYTEEWENAVFESTSIIENTNLYAWESDLNQVFLIQSSTAIWQLKSVSGINTLEGETFIFVSGPPIVGLSNNLIDAFGPSDLRRTSWINEVTDGTDIWYHAFKYKESGGATGTTLEYSVMFRLAEQYLIRAEARAQLGDIAGAQSDLNTVRNRAGLGNTTAATTNDVLEAILQERQVELFTELGHRFFDLKRTGRADAVLGPVKPGWNATDILLPIPESELLVNPNLAPQNPGY